VSDSAKNLWKKYLGMTVTNFGVSGAGFSSLQGKSLQRQVDEAGVFDIYILWASTNDYTNHREVGDYTDYTEFDNYDKNKLSTQAGGINYCIKKIYEKNPHAVIYFFTSGKAFVLSRSYTHECFGLQKIRSATGVLSCISLMEQRIQVAGQGHACCQWSYYQFH
jgi:hypothetical protein